MCRCNYFERGQGDGIAGGTRENPSEGTHQLTVAANELARASWSAFMCPKGSPGCTLPGTVLSVYRTLVVGGDDCDHIPFVDSGEYQHGTPLCQSYEHERGDPINRINSNYNVRRRGAATTTEEPRV